MLRHLLVKAKQIRRERFILGDDRQALVQSIIGGLNEDRVVGEVLSLVFFRHRQKFLPFRVTENLQRPFGSDPLAGVFFVRGMFLQLFDAFVEDKDRLLRIEIAFGSGQDVHPIWEIGIHERASIHDQIVERCDLFG